MGHGLYRGPDSRELRDARCFGEQWKGANPRHQALGLPGFGGCPVPSLVILLWVHGVSTAKLLAQWQLVYCDFILSPQKNRNFSSRGIPPIYISYIYILFIHICGKWWVYNLFPYISIFPYVHVHFFKHIIHITYIAYVYIYIYLNIYTDITCIYIHITWRYICYIYIYIFYAHIYI